MSEAVPKRSCDGCGRPIPDDAPEELCPACVAEDLFGQSSEEDSESKVVEFTDYEMIGPYKIIEEIGEGGFGIVYRAEETGAVSREVAVKVLKPGMDTRQIIARFEAERQALALLDHPNIARILGVGESAEGRPYFAMELVTGKAITQYCEEKKMPLRERLDLFIQLCGAIHHAHQKGIIHRDLKPSNILVTSHSRGIRVIDFGIAKAISEPLTGKTMFTHSGMMVGTPEYMSPEQAAGGLDIDTRADVYALGMVLYDLIVGGPAWTKSSDGLTHEEMLRRIQEEDPMAPSRRLAELSPQAPKLPRDLDLLVLKAVSKERNHRYGSALALAEDITRFLNHEPIRARPPSTIYRMVKFVRKHRVGVFSWLTFAAIIVAAAVVAGILAFQAERRRQETEELRLKAKRDFSRADLRIASELGRSGRQADAVAHLCRALRNDPENRAAVQKLVHALAYSGFPIQSAAPQRVFSDSCEVSFVSRDHLIARTRGGRVQLIVDGDQRELLATGATELSLSEKGKRLAVRVGDEDWLVYDLQGTRVADGISGERGVLTEEGDYLVCVDERSPHSLVAHPLHEGSEAWEVIGETPVTALAASRGGNRIAVGHEDGRVKAFAGNGKLLWEEHLSSVPVTQVEMVRGALLAAGGKEVLLEKRGFTSASNRYSFKDSVAELALSANGKVAAFAAGTELRVCGVDGDDLQEHRFDIEVDRLAFGPKAEHLYVALKGGQIFELEVESGRLLGLPLRHRRSVIGMTVTAGEVVVAAGNGIVRRWQRGTAGAQLAQFNHGGERPTWVGFSDSTSNVMSGTIDGRAFVWDSDGKKVRIPERLIGPQVPLRTTKSGLILVFHTDDLTLSTWNGWAFSNAGQPVSVGGWILGAIPSEDGRLAVTANKDGSVSCWDLVEGKERHRWSGLHPAVGNRKIWEDLGARGAATLEMSSDGRYAVVAAGASAGYILRLSAPYQVVKLPHAGPVRWIGLNPAGTVVASASVDNTVRLWSFPEGKALHGALRHQDGCSEWGLRGRFSQDGERLVTTGSYDNTARVWDVASGQLAIDPLPHPDVARAIGIDPERRRIVTGCDDGITRLWDTETGALIGPEWKLPGKVCQVNFDRMGLRILAADEEGHCAVYETVPYGFDLAPWFLEFAEALVGRRFNERNVLEAVPVEKLAPWREKFRAPPAEDARPSVHLAHWLLRHSERRDRTPFLRYWDIDFQWFSREGTEAARRAMLERALPKKDE